MRREADVLLLGADIIDICEQALDEVLRRDIAGQASELRLQDLRDAVDRSKSSITPAMLADYESFAAT